MPRSYDTTGHRPYPRVTRIEIQYPETGVPVVTYDETAAIVDGDSRVQLLASGATRHVLQLNPPAFSDQIPLVHPATGAEIPGQTITMQQLMLGITAVIRHDQLRRDADADAASQAASSNQHEGAA